MEQLQKVWGILYCFRRQLATWGMFLFAALLAVHVIFGTNGWMAYEQKKAEFQKVTQEVKEIQRKNEELQQNINDLKTKPKVIEKLARETLGYAKKGDVVYIIPERKQEPTATAQAKSEAAKK
jgi:cell division protein FtsB